jgi:hypothetical protein
MGAALVLLVVVAAAWALVALEMTECTASLAELVMLAISEVREAAASPVAVERIDDKLERALPASWVMELILDSAAELTDERAEPTTLVRDAMGPATVVVVWACLHGLAWAP